MNNLIKDQHYTPRTYLKRWYLPDKDGRKTAQLFDIQKQKLNPNREDSKALSFASSLYSYEVNKEFPDNKFEKSFQSGEKALGELLHNVFNWNNFDLKMADYTSNDILMGILGLHHRTKYQLERFQEYFKDRKKALENMEKGISLLANKIKSSVFTFYDFSSREDLNLITCDSPFIDLNIMRQEFVLDVFDQRADLIPSGRLPCGPKCFLDIYHNHNPNFPAQLTSGGHIIFVTEDKRIFFNYIKFENQSSEKHEDFLVNSVQQTNFLTSLRARDWVLYSPLDQSSSKAHAMFNKEEVEKRIKTDRLLVF